MNCAQNEKKGAAKKKVKRLATVQAGRNSRSQQRGRRNVPAGANLRPLKGTAAKDNALPKRPPAKAVGAKPVKPKLGKIDHDDSDTNSGASTSRAKRIPTKGKPEDTDVFDKKSVKRTDSNEGIEGPSAKKTKEAGSADAPKKKVTKVVNKLVAKNNIRKAGNPSILKYLSKPVVKAKQPRSIVDNVKAKAKTKWVVALKEGGSAPISRRSQGLVLEEVRSESPTTTKKLKSTPATAKKKKEDAGEDAVSSEQESEPMEVVDGEGETVVASLETSVATPTDSAKKSAVRKASISGNPRVTRSLGGGSLGGRILRNGKTSKVKKTLQLADGRKSRRSKTDEELKSMLGDDLLGDSKSEVDPEKMEEEESQLEAGSEEPDLGIPAVERSEPKPLPDSPEMVIDEPRVPEPVQQPNFHPVSPFTPDDVMARFPKDETTEAEVEPKAAVAATTPVANSILSNKNFTDTNSNNVKENRKPTDVQPLKTVDTIINDIHTDWDSDEDAQASLRGDAKVSFGNSSPAQVTKENEAPKYILNKAPNRQLVSTPPLIEPEETSPSDSRNVGMKMPPTTECLLKTKEINGFADSVELLAKRSPKIDFELLRRRTKRSMSLSVDPNDKLSPSKRTYGAAKPRDTIRTLVSMPKLSPEVDLPKSPNKNIGQTDKFVPKSEELFDNLIARTKDKTDESQPQEPILEKDSDVLGALNGTCDEDDRKSSFEDDVTSSTPVLPSANPSPVPLANLEAELPVEREMHDKEDELKHDDDGDLSFGSEKKSDDFSLHLTIDSVDENSIDKQLDTETMDSEIPDLPKDEDEVPPEEVEKTEGAVSHDENSSEHPLSPPKLKPFDSDSIVDEEEIMAEMVATPEEPKEDPITDSKEETAEPEKEESEQVFVSENKEEDNSNSSEASESYIQKIIESQEEVEPTPPEEELKAVVADSTEPAKNEAETPTEQVTSLEGELTTPKDPEPRTDAQPSARIDSKETCGSSASSLSSILDADTTRLNLDLNLAEIERKRREIFEEEESPERRAVKEHVLNSLGLQSRRSVAEAAAIATSGTSRSAKRAQRKDSGGTSASSGRLKVVINVPKEKSKPLRMLFKNGKPYPSHPEDMPPQHLVPPLAEGDECDIDAKNSAANSHIEGNGTADNALLCLSDYRVNIGALPDIAGSSSGVDADGKSKQPGSLVIPEKSSSFSIHPSRLCSDVCSYCFGKFGSLDTPCHIAQLKSRERQMKILSVETQLAMDSCLCDACIRYVDRKANCPSYKPPGGRREKNKYSGTQAVCCVNGCPQSAVHSLRKKWFFKIRRSVAQKCPVNLDLVNPQLPLPLCAEHYSYMDYFMVCGLCKRRLTRSHMYNLTDVREINLCLEADGIPARLSDKLFVCKLCRYYATMRVKHPRSHYTLSTNQREFFNSYRKRILRNHDIAVSGSEDNGEGDPELPKDRSVSPAGEGSCNEEQPKGKRRRARSNPTPPATSDNNDVEAPKKKARTSAGSVSKSKDRAEHSDSATERTDADKVSDKAKSHQPPLRLCLSNVTTNSQSGSAEWVRKDIAPFFPGEDQLALHANIQFQDDVPSEQKDWERCTSTLQFDKETKRLWQELQRPYGSQSSFIRHLVLMERYWRQGELTLTATTDRANSYTRSVQNRLKAYGTTYVSKKVPQAAATPPPPTHTSVPAPAKPEEKPTAADKKAAATEKPVAVSPQHTPVAPPPPQPKVVLPRLPPKSQAAKAPQTKPPAQPKASSKQQKILPKPPAPPTPPTSVWEPISKNATQNRPFFVSSPPVVNLTSSVSLTAVPAASTGVSPVPEIPTVNSETVMVGPVRTGRPSSWGSSGGFVSIVPSGSTASQTVRVSTSPNVSASITPIFSSNSTNSLSPALSQCAGLRVDGKVTGSQGNKSQHLVQVTAGGKSFSLTIAQFKKLQALRQQRQIDQQKKGRRTVGSGTNKQKQRRASTSLSVTEPMKECVGINSEREDSELNSQESFVPMICDVRSVTSSDQAIRMWDEPDRTEECKLNPQLEITAVEAAAALPKTSKDLTVTHVSSEMTLTTLVPSRALAADSLPSTATQPPATVTAPGPAAAVPVAIPATVLVPSISPSVVQPTAPSLSPSLVAPIVAPIVALTPAVTALPAIQTSNPLPPLPPAVEIIPAAVDIFPN